jgi:uncharacterized protein YndB with AHSA1/START domain
MDFEVNVRERILKPLHQVFDAFVDPAKMSNYFISGSSGPLRAGERVIWEFADVGAKVAVDVAEFEEDRRVSWDWRANNSESTRTTVQFAADGPDATVVTVTEGTFALTDADVKRALSQNAGWTYTLCGLKAYAQFGINLREGLDKRLTDVS